MNEARALPLRAHRVVAIEHAVAAPLCSRHLAELGADVIKVEHLPDGDFARRYDGDVHGYASHFVWLNAGKRSLALDIRAPGGADVLRRLLRRADVLVANLGPGSLERLIGREELQELNDRLVTITISGYGSGGPYEHRRAFDLLVQGEGGVTRNTGTLDQPAKPGVSLADLAAGVYALAAVNAALLDRERTGRGARMDISMFDAVAEWMMPLLLAQRHTGSSPPPAGTRHASICPYGPFDTADGRMMNIAVQNERQWERLCADVLDGRELLDDPRFATNASRLLHREQVEAAVNERTRRLTSDALEHALDEAGVPWGNLNSTADVVDHPQLAARRRWRPITLPEGSPAEILLAPFLSVDDLGAGGAGDAEVPHVPAVGEHTRDVLSELGYSHDEVGALLAAGTVAAAIRSADSAEEDTAVHVE